MRKLSQTEELVKILAGRARRHTLTPEQISRAMDEQEYDVSGLDALYAALEARGVDEKIAVRRSLPFFHKILKLWGLCGSMV